MGRSDAALFREQPAGDVVTYTHAIVQRDGTEQRVSRDDGLDETRFVWDAKLLLEEHDGLGTPAARYHHEPADYGHLVSQHRDAASDYHHFDASHARRKRNADAL